MKCYSKEKRSCMNPSECISVYAGLPQKEAPNSKLVAGRLWKDPTLSLNTYSTHHRYLKIKRFHAKTVFWSQKKMEFSQHCPHSRFHWLASLRWGTGFLVHHTRGL